MIFRLPESGWDYNQMNFYFGIYDSGHYWHEGKPEREVELNQRFCKEAAERYADRKAFAGWYLTHEIHEHDEVVTRLIERLARHVKSLKDGPVLMSPYVRGRKQCGDNPITPEEHEAQWDTILSLVEQVQDAESAVSDDGRADEG